MSIRSSHSHEESELGDLLRRGIEIPHGSQSKNGNGRKKKEKFINIKKNEKQPESNFSIKTCLEKKHSVFAFEISTQFDSNLMEIKEGNQLWKAKKGELLH
ncbi:CLUMA_CG020625, isoform A [Clunio marinus]|uniref:CLUMA_CG020625, isoform A n=1 Tax=Clunio marinus TaxID=568069 RepID=A0A1J1J6Q8_9DIPT|nr:CLUMA_CG020625, isoform A [Clunio marinus]